MPEGGGEVVDGLGVRPGEVDEDDVGAPAGGDAADPVVESDGPRALEGGVVEGLAGRPSARAYGS